MNKEALVNYLRDGDYITKFRTVAQSIIGKYDDPEQRKRAIEELIDAYVEARSIEDDPHNQRPRPDVLYMLANEIMRETLTDKSTNKTRRDERPVLNSQQIRHRKKRETNLYNARTYDQHGNDRRPPKRSKKVDNLRVRRYRKYTKPGQVQTYNIADLTWDEVVQRGLDKVFSYEEWEAMRQRKQEVV